MFFKLKLVSWIFTLNAIKNFPSDFHPFIPGLEMKLAIEATKKLKKPVILGGLALDESAIEALRNENTYFNPFALFWNFAFAFNRNKLWLSEIKDNYQIIDTHGGEAFAESIDSFRLNWFIKLFEKWAPH